MLNIFFIIPLFSKYFIKKRLLKDFELKKTKTKAQKKHFLLKKVNNLEKSEYFI